MRPGTTGASLFSNPTTGGGGGNLFGQPGAGFGVGTTGATGGMGGTTGTANMFANPTTGTTPSLFSTPATTGTATNMFNPNPAPSGGNLFGQPSTATNPAASGSLFSAPTFNQPAGGNMFAPGVSNPQNPTQGYTKEQQMMQCAEFIAAHKKDSLKRIIETSFLELSDDNIFRNQRLSRTQYENLKKTALHVVKEIRSVEDKAKAITEKNKELFGLMETYNNIAREKLGYFKKNFLQVSSKSNTISEIKDTLDEFERITDTEFSPFYDSIKNSRYTIPVITPSDFEMRLSEFTLRQAQNLLQKLNDYERCQQSTEVATYIDVIPALIDYYKNVTCLVYEFRERYAKFRDEARRSRGSNFIDIESKLQAQKDSISGKASNIFEKILDIEIKLKEKIQHCKDVKMKFKLL